MACDENTAYILSITGKTKNELLIIRHLFLFQQPRLHRIECVSAWKRLEPRRMQEYAEYKSMAKEGANYVPEVVSLQDRCFGLGIWSPRASPCATFHTWFAVRTIRTGHQRQGFRFSLGRKSGLQPKKKDEARNAVKLFNLNKSFCSCCLMAVGLSSRAVLTAKPRCLAR
jgi:hypothetical protein